MKYPFKMPTLAYGLLLCAQSWAQGGAVLTFEDGEYELEIPYFEFNGNAFSVDLHTPEDSNDLFFLVDLTSLSQVEPEDDNDDIVPDPGNGACSATADAALLSCRAGVVEDNFIALGNCFNVSNSLSADACRELAMEEMDEADEECDEQHEARLKLCAVIGEDPYDPDMDPANFMTAEQIMADPNPWFPLVPGNQWIYESEDELVTVTVTEDTLEIAGITAIVVNDIVTEDGEPVEDTDDYYAQDLEGNVWYMGEIARNYEDGRLVDLEGSWLAGTDGAKAGILFRASPLVGETYRQEFLLGEAEDIGETLSITANQESGEDAGVVCQGDCLRVLEYTPVEPDALEEKYYYPGIGNIVTVDLESGDREELVDYTVQ